MPPTPLRADDPWNLRPYDVPWGDDYCDYEPGRLPGHDGVCLVLRSPTPIEQKRTAVACKHCRQRKAKCSGDRPACSRCADRGRRCVYPDPEDRPSQPPPTRTARTSCDAPLPLHAAPRPRRASGRRSASPMLKREPQYDADLAACLYDLPAAGHWSADSPDSGYSSSPSSASLADSDELAQTTHFAYPAYVEAHATMSPAIFAPTPVRAETGQQQQQAYEYAYPQEVFVEQPPALDVASTSYAYNTASHYASTQAAAPAPYATAHDYAPATWYSEHDGSMYYLLGRQQAFPAYPDPVSYAHAVY